MPGRGLSLTWGLHSPMAMAVAVMPGRSKRVYQRRADRARWAESQVLSQAGFQVDYNPTSRNLFHCTVSYPEERDTDVAIKFNDCFTEVPPWRTDD